MDWDSNKVIIIIIIIISIITSIGIYLMIACIIPRVHYMTFNRGIFPDFFSENPRAKSHDFCWETQWWGNIKEFLKLTFSSAPLFGLIYSKTMENVFFLRDSLLQQHFCKTLQYNDSWGLRIASAL